jgi:hypothetical protein
VEYNPHPIHQNLKLNPESQIKPLESQTDTLSNVTATGDASSVHIVNDDEDSEATPPPPPPRKNTPPHQSIFHVDHAILNLVASPEADQTKPPSPPPSVTKPPSENQPTPELEQQ